MKKTTALSVILCFCISFIYTQSKIEAELLALANSSPQVEAIIIFKEQAELSLAKGIQNKATKGSYVFQSLKQVANRSQKTVRTLLQNAQIDFQTLLIVNAIHAKLDLQMLNQIAAQPEVLRIQQNPVGVVQELRPARSNNYGRDLVEWGVEMIGATQVWEMGYRGQGVVVGGQDTGVEWDHNAIKEQYRGWNGEQVDHNYNWHDAIHDISHLHDPPGSNPCGLDSTIPCDDNNHGTYITGIMLGDDGGSNQIGVAPEAKWIAARSMERGWGSLYTYLECFQWFLAPTDLNNENPDPSKAPHVINNSWSCPKIEGCYLKNWDILELAINNLRAAGIVVVVSAGNTDPICGEIKTPSAIFEGSFTIGASDDVDTLGNFSSAGPVLVDHSRRLKPNVVAPGVNVRSARRDGLYLTASGTSAAGPYVAGLVALMISANPSLAGQVDVIETIIEESAIPLYWEENCDEFLGEVHPNTFYGYGRIDAVAAVEQALLLTSTEEVAPSNQLKVFPNPFSDLLFFELQNWKQEVQLQLVQADGKLILNRTFQPEEVHFISVPVKNLSSGLYFYRLQSQTQLQTGKLFKSE